MWMPDRTISMSPDRRPVKGLQGPHRDIVSLAWRMHDFKLKKGTGKATSIQAKRPIREALREELCL